MNQISDGRDLGGFGKRYGDGKIAGNWLRRNGATHGDEHVVGRKIGTRTSHDTTDVCREESDGIAARANEREAGMLCARDQMNYED